MQQRSGSVYSIRVFERRILARMFRFVRIRDKYRIKSNRAIDEVINGKGVVRFAKSTRMKWRRMSNKKINGRMNGPRRRGSTRIM